MTSSPSTWHRVVAALGLGWGALEVGVLLWSPGSENISVPWLLLGLAFIGLSLGWQGGLLLRGQAPSRRTALGTAFLTTLAALMLLFAAAVAYYLRNSPSIIPDPDASVNTAWIALLVAALMRLPLLAALVSFFSVRPQAPR